MICGRSTAYSNMSNLSQVQPLDLQGDLNPLMFHLKLLLELFVPSTTFIMEDAKTMDTTTRSIVGYSYWLLNRHMIQLCFS